MVIGPKCTSNDAQGCGETLPIIALAGYGSTVQSDVVIRPYAWDSMSYLKKLNGMGKKIRERSSGNGTGNELIMVVATKLSLQKSMAGEWRREFRKDERGIKVGGGGQEKKGR